MSVWLVKKLENLIRSGFQEADKGIAFGGLVLVLVLVFIPFAATINALIGGSPFLFRYYLLLLAALVILNFAGETGRFRFINALAAAFLGVSLIVVIPFYVLRSFTDVIVHSQGFLKSLLVAFFWYMAAYAFWWECIQIRYNRNYLISFSDKAIPSLLGSAAPYSLPSIISTA